MVGGDGLGPGDNSLVHHLAAASEEDRKDCAGHCLESWD